MNLATCIIKHMNILFVPFNPLNCSHVNEVFFFSGAQLPLPLLNESPQRVLTETHRYGFIVELFYFYLVRCFEQVAREWSVSIWLNN